VVTLVVGSFRRVKIMPFLVVNWDAHLRRVSMVETFGAAEIFVSPVVLWIVDIRVMIKSFPVSGANVPTPTPTKSLLGVGWLNCEKSCKRRSAKQRQEDAACHRVPPLCSEKFDTEILCRIDRVKIGNLGILIFAWCERDWFRSCHCYHRRSR